jgi:hypothetical protein
MLASLQVWPSSGYNSPTSTKKSWEQTRCPKRRIPPVKCEGDASLPNNLPSELSSFVGREKELPEVMRVLEDTRLLTLTAGKIPDVELRVYEDALTFLSETRFSL